jgi:hypothetical protein
MKVAPADPSYDVFHGGPRALDAGLLAAVNCRHWSDRPPIERGRTLLLNLISSPFGGTVYPVNPKRTSVLGVRHTLPVSPMYRTAVDLAVIATPAATVPAVMAGCAQRAAFARP